MEEILMAHDVFISYSAQDKTIADAVCATLESRKIRCWISPRDVMPGVSYAEALVRAINESKIFVLVFSSQANSSPQVLREVERAVNKGIPIIPFRIENVVPTKSMEYFLMIPHWLDALTPPMEKHLHKLADTVQALLNEVNKTISENHAVNAAPVEQPVERKEQKSEQPQQRKKTLKPIWLWTGIPIIVLIVTLLIIFIPKMEKSNEKQTETPPVFTAATSSTLSSGPTSPSTSVTSTTSTTAVLSTPPATTPVVTAVTTTETTPAASANWWDIFGAPNYGGTMAIPITQLSTVSLDTADLTAAKYQYWSEGLFYSNWSTDRSVWPFTTGFAPAEFSEGLLAESWEQNASQTMIVHLRHGVHWQNKAPVNGREITAGDVQYNYDRLLGTGSGFTQPVPAFSGILYNIQRVTVIDQYTLKFDLKDTNALTISQIMDARIRFLPPEIVQKSVLTDWKSAAGTGPWTLSDFVAASSMTLSKNPDYWGYDERHPQYQLPYLDNFKLLVINDSATTLAALRTRKIDVIADPVSGISWENAQSLKQTNPDIQQGWLPSPGPSLELRCDKTPFNDIRVRKALQMAVDRKTIANSVYGGSIDGTPAGILNPVSRGFTTPYAQWPADLQQEYSYNPNKAKQSLAEAGFPSGFSTNMIVSTNDSQPLMQILQAYFAAIGVDMQIKTLDPVTFNNYLTNGKYDQMVMTYTTGETGSSIEPFYTRYSSSPTNYTHNNDTAYDNLANKIKAAASQDDLKKACIAADMYALEKHWAVNICPLVTPVLWQSYIKGYSGEINPGGFDFARWWRVAQ